MKTFENPFEETFLLFHLYFKWFEINYFEKVDFVSIFYVECIRFNRISIKWCQVSTYIIITLKLSYTNAIIIPDIILTVDEMMDKIVVL